MFQYSTGEVVEGVCHVLRSNRHWGYSQKGHSDNKDGTVEDNARKVITAFFNSDFKSLISTTTVMLQHPECYTFKVSCSVLAGENTASLPLMFCCGSLLGKPRHGSLSLNDCQKAWKCSPERPSELFVVTVLGKRNSLTLWSHVTMWSFHHHEAVTEVLGGQWDRNSPEHGALTPFS